MKNVFLGFLSLMFLSSNCDEKYLKCSDCYDRESVLKETDRVAERVLNEKTENLRITVYDETDSITIDYMRNDPSKFGGEMMITISKKDCKIVNYGIGK